MKKLSVGLAPLLVLVVIAAWSTCRAVGAGAGVPGDAAWARAAALVREQHRPGDLIVFAPGWVDPVGRMHLGDLIPIEMAARQDADRYAVIWELSVRGARAPDTRGLRAGWTRTVGGVTVRRFERQPAEVITDLVAVAAAAPASLRREGLFARGPDVVLAEVGFAPHRCVQLVPSPGQEVSLTFPAVALGTMLAGGVGLADVFTRRDQRAPVELIVRAGGAEIARVEVGVDDGWVRWRGATTPGTADVTLTARTTGIKGSRDRLVCVAAEARR